MQACGCNQRSLHAPVVFDASKHGRLRRPSSDRLGSGRGLRPVLARRFRGLSATVTTPTLRTPSMASAISAAKRASNSAFISVAIRSLSTVLGWLRRCELPHLAYVRTLLSLPQVIAELVAQPRFRCSPPCPFEAQRHLGRDAAMAVEQARQMPTRNV